jgi:hypothetical protein
MHTPLLLLALALPQGPTTLTFDEILEKGPGGVHLSARVHELESRRVRMVGFMPQMEVPPRGAFYLCPRPIFVDESGGGTADLPPTAVRVVVRSAPGEEVAFIPGPLEVTGTLEIGRREEADGTVSFVRLILDRPEDGAPSASEPTKSPE